MPRIHWLLLAVGVAIILLASLLGDADAPLTTPVTTALGNDGAGTADLAMTDADISQYATSGRLAYRLHAERIGHDTGAAVTRLTLPRLVLHPDSASPWHIDAGRGLLTGAGAWLGTGDAASPGRERLLLADDVVVRHRAGEPEWIELRTTQLEIRPRDEYAVTDATVTIETEFGRTTATGLEARLDSGLLRLGTGGTDRVRTVLFPDRIPRERHSEAP